MPLCCYCCACEKESLKQVCSVSILIAVPTLRQHAPFVGRHQRALHGALNPNRLRMQENWPLCGGFERHDRSAEPTFATALHTTLSCSAYHYHHRALTHLSSRAYRQNRVCHRQQSRKREFEGSSLLTSDRSPYATSPPAPSGA